MTTQLVRRQDRQFSVPVQAIKLDSTFRGRTTWRQARRSRKARATGGWLAIQRFFVLSGVVAWVAILGAFAAVGLGLWPQ